MSPVVNDIHSGLNSTKVAAVIEVESSEAIQSVVHAVRARGGTIAVAGGHHAMGGQQFAAGGTLLDTRPMKRVLAFDRERGTIELEAGIQWPDLVDWLITSQDGSDSQWGIAQKQTGADRFTIGGSISANCHGRGLTMQPIVADVDAIRVIQADGSIVECSREQNDELFRFTVGGYGLAGVIYSVTLRLAPRQKLERIVEMTTVPELLPAFEARIAAGFLYGDFQFAIDPDSRDFLHAGVFSCYRAVDPNTPIAPEQRALSREDWQMLLWLAHTGKARAFEEYSRHYLATSGQIYWSDLHQLADYTDGYHEDLDRVLGANHPATEMISELYVPRVRLGDFMAAVADDFRSHGVDVVYGTVRLIKRDEDTFLRWAKDDYACVIFNLHTVHTDEGLAHSVAAFRRLIDLAMERDGSYFLTYHHWATREQLETCYPEFVDFLRLKGRHDPDELFQSDWYRHYARLFAEEL
jgi:FAD/FMN-containing dehydrogenase